MAPQFEVKDLSSSYIIPVRNWCFHRLAAESFLGNASLVYTACAFPGADNSCEDGNHSLVTSSEGEVLCFTYIIIAFNHPPAPLGFPGGKEPASSKEPACQFRGHKRLGFDPWVGKIPWRRAWQCTPGFLPGESHGQRSVEGYSPWGHTDLAATEPHARKPSQIVTITTHILHRKTLRLTVTKQPAPGLTVSKGQSQDSSSSLPGFKTQTWNSDDLSE